LPVPIVVIGGGRWARTWASVVAAARGSGEGLIMAARTDPDDVRAWARAREDLVGMSVVSSLAEAFASEPRPAAAIVSSRPRDHVPDSLEALRKGLHVLVEKPVSLNAASGRSLIVAAQKAKRVLAMGTEFAYLPAFHQLAEELEISNGKDIELSLEWHDLAKEFRHGAIKIRHEELGLLLDLLPHAFSIFRIFVPREKLNIVHAHHDTTKARGQIEFRDDRGRRYDVRCDMLASARRRCLKIKTGTIHASVDFGNAKPVIMVDDRPYPLDERFVAMTSTLRLELGAFLAEAGGATAATFISSEIPALLVLQEELEQALPGNPGSPRDNGIHDPHET
jgi:predicted dehydrogenase